jgi:cardiolipin synthase
MESVHEGSLRFAPTRQRVRQGNAVHILCDGAETFPAMLEAIRSATKTIYAEFYIWRGDVIGWQVADALIAQHRNGIRVQAMYDSFGCVDVDPLIFDTMRDEGIECLEYRPLAPWRPHGGFLRRNHRKLLVIDDTIGFVGGINLSKDFLSKEQGGQGWRDYCVRIEGSAVRDLSRLFSHTWVRTHSNARRAKVAPPETAEPAETGSTFVAILGNSEMAQRFRIRRSYIHAINQAQHQISIANAYFLPDRNIRRALYRAKRRGVTIHIMVPGLSDVTIVAWATRHLYGRFLRRGIRIFEYTRSMLHAKMAAIDGKWSTIGSYNLDHQSLRYNLEVNASIFDLEVGQKMMDALQKDIEACREVTIQDVRKRSWIERLRYWLSFQFRKML